MRRELVANYTRSGEGWLARADLDQETATVFGRTIERARIGLVEELVARARAAIDKPGLWAVEIVLEDHVDLPPGVTAAVDGARAARDHAIEAAAAAAQATRAAVRQLADEGLSLRDSAYLLGVSHARIQQLLGGSDARI